MTAAVLITPRSLKAARWQTCMHLNLGREGSVLNKACVDFPGLIVSDSSDKKARVNTRRFYVEGDAREFLTVTEAASAWNARARAKLAP